MVQRGDTLYSIAFRNNLDYRDLAAWNGIGSDYRIYPGQRLRLTSPAQKRRQVVVPAASPPVAVEQKPPSLPSMPSSPVAPAPTVAANPAPAATPAAPGSHAFDPRHWVWPTAGTVVQKFDLADGEKGIDIAGRPGQAVAAAAPGRVVYSGNALKGYGELIIIEHDNRYLSAYGYNRKRLVKEGQWVRAGQVIARMGEGPERQPELHFEIRIKGKPVAPLRYLPAR